MLDIWLKSLLLSYKTNLFPKENGKFPQFSPIFHNLLLWRASTAVDDDDDSGLRVGIQSFDRWHSLPLSEQKIQC